MGLTEIVEEVRNKEKSFRKHSRRNLYGSLVSLGLGVYFISQTLVSIQSKEDLAKLALPLIFLPISLSFYNNSRFWRGWARELRERYPAYFDSGYENKKRSN